MWPFIVVEIDVLINRRWDFLNAPEAGWVDGFAFEVAEEAFDRCIVQW